MLLLYNPSSSAGKKPVLPMSLLALGAGLEGRIDYRIVDGNLETDPLAALENEIRVEDRRVLAMTVMPGPQLSEAVALARELKKRHRHLVIVWGGYFPTQHASACLGSPFVDYVLRGHADKSFADLLDALRLGKDAAVRSTPGLSYRSESGAVIENPLPAIPDPDELPDYPYHRLPMERYVRATFMGKRTLPHHSSYGCPFTCNFCAVVNMVGGRWKAQSAERTAGVLARLVSDFGADAVELYDNNFFVDEARVAEVAARIEDLHIGWWGEARVDTLLQFRHDTWERMRRGGLRMVFLGAESGSDDVLRRMNKGGTASAAKTVELAARMKAYGIVPEFSFVVGNPPDPREDVDRTLSFIRRLKRVNPASEIVLYLYTPVPLEGELYDLARARGFDFPRTLDEWTSREWTVFSARRSANLPWLERSLKRRLWDFERVLNAYYPTATDRRLGQAARLVLRTTSAWRYHSRLYRHPFELRALQKLIAYQRPETSGF
jgi:anaerobic magnesium-protoporphyrin IX monomethyl ester cyclase